VTERTSITFETEETVVFKRAAALASAFCPKCDATVEMISPQAFASVLGASERQIFRLIEAERLYTVESDVLRVCLGCLENEKENLVKNRNVIHTPKLILPTLLVVLALFSAAAAQSNSYANMLTITSNASQSLFRAQTQVNQQRESMARAAGVTDYSYERQPTRAYPITATDFQVLQAPIMPDQFANSAQGVDPQTRQQMRTMFLQTLAAFEKSGRKDNMASAFTWISACAFQVRDGKEPSDADEAKLTAYFNNTLAVSPDYALLTPYKKQMLYESLIITGGIMIFLDNQGKETNNPRLRAQAAEMSKQVLKIYLGING